MSKKNKTENEKYLSEQLITYLGNKRKLLDFIESAVVDIKKELGKDKLVLLDGFAGSGVVSRSFKKHAKKVISNDLENYSYIIGKCYLTNGKDVDMERIKFHLKEMEKIRKSVKKGIIQRMYAPKDDKNIQKGERVFYTTKNAQAIDSFMKYIHEKVEEELKPFLLAPLLSEASIHANTSGVFKGFYKNSETGKGQFGGNAQNALVRILGDIKLQEPIFSNFDCRSEVHQKDINELIKELPEVDVAYYDPPYNQHPYGSNYFMLNIISENKEPKEVSEVSGIPTDWKKSAYNKRVSAEKFLDDLAKNTKAKYLLLSYNDEGIIPIDRIKEILGQYGEVTLLEKEYNAFRGSRNLGDRALKVKELLFKLKKKSP